jgi:hypothetical protein
MSHYYDEDPSVISNEQRIQYQLKHHKIDLITYLDQVDAFLKKFEQEHLNHNLLYLSKTLRYQLLNQFYDALIDIVLFKLF